MAIRMAATAAMVIEQAKETEHTVDIQDIQDIRAPALEMQPLTVDLVQFPLHYDVPLAASFTWTATRSLTTSSRSTPSTATTA